MAVPVITFPNIAPKGERQLTFGSFTSHDSQFASGLSNVRPIGTGEGELTFDIDFGPITDASTTLIMQAYDLAYGSTFRVTLPSELFLGIGVEIIDLIPAYTAWHFAAAPVVRFIQPGWGSTRVQFIGGGTFYP